MSLYGNIITEINLNYNKKGPIKGFEWLPNLLTRKRGFFLQKRKATQIPTTV